MLLTNKLKAYPQNIIGSTYFPKKSINYANIQIDTQTTAYQILNQIRAFCFRDYQLPRLFGYNIFYARLTSERSHSKAGIILDDNNEYLKLSTIDYNILLYKDKLDKLMEYCKTGNLTALQKQEDLIQYLDEREKEHGWNMLMIAVYNNKKDVVSYLLSVGADINSQNNNGTTPLMYAKDAGIKNKDFNLLFYLLEHGADLYLQDYHGKNLLDYVKHENNKLYALIKKYHD